MAIVNTYSVLCSLMLNLFIICVKNAIIVDVYRNQITHDKPEMNIQKPNQTNETVVLYKFLNAEYYGLIGIGKPAQQFKVIFDTSWADSWVPSQHCGYLEIACMLHTRYDSSKSSTYIANGTVFEQNDKKTGLHLKGLFSVDNFHLAHLKVANQTFIEMTKMPYLPFALLKADGIIGLGFKDLAFTGTEPFFYNMIYQKLINKNVFTFYMNRDATTDKAGTLILGGVDRAHVVGNMTFVPVKGRQYWKVQMNKVFVHSDNTSYPFCKSGCEAVFDTSANTISGPPEDIIAINNLLHAKSLGNFWPYKYMVDCRTFAKLPHITFVIRNTEFTIQSKYYIQHLTTLGMQLCLSPFVESPNDMWVLGGAFLMEYYTEYDLDKAVIGIGKSVF